MEDFNKEELKHLKKTIKACSFMEEKYGLEREKSIRDMDKKICIKLKRKMEDE